MSVTMLQDRCFTHTCIPEVTLFKEVGYSVTPGMHTGKL